VPAKEAGLGIIYHDDSLTITMFHGRHGQYGLCQVRL
jgi:hypothetical protein